MIAITEYVDYLKDPQLVVSFQRIFGVNCSSEIKRKTSTSSKFQNKTVNITSNNSQEYSQLKQRHSAKKEHKSLNHNLADNGKDVKVGLNSEMYPNNLPEDTLSSESDVETLPYVINVKFWYYFFMFGTYLGDEIFYASFIPFWFWNIDGAVGRRIVMVWTIVMYIGQGIKDIICWPRPASPPVIRLQNKWSLEHGMPSTHAMVGVAIPFSVIVYTMSRYQYPVGLGVAVAVCWCTVISLSRIYLGMHSVLDIVAGLILAVLLMIPVVPLVDSLDVFLLTNRWSPIVLISVTIPMIVFYPTTDRWTPTRGDTTMIVSFCVGVYIGAWTNYHLGVMSEPSQPPPYTIIWPSWPMFGTGVLRTVIGLCSIVATQAVCKSAQHATVRCLLPSPDSLPAPTRETLHSRTRTVVELTSKYLAYILLGFNILYLMPNVFKMLRIERPTFYTEM